MIATRKCPILSHEFDPLRLPDPLKRYDLAKTLLPIGDLAGFESHSEAEAEDRFRADALCNSKTAGGRELGSWLHAATDEGSLPLSSVSSVYTRTVRQRLLGDLARLLDERVEGEEPPFTFTLINSRWRIHHSRMMSLQVKKLKAALREYFRRVGIAKAKGFLFSGFHGEFDGEFFQLHVHGVAIGEKARLLPSLRGKFGFVTTRTIRRPVQVGPLQNLPRQISYLYQQYWPYRPRKRSGKARIQIRARIKEPFYGRLLVWMANQHVFDFILMNGLRLKACNGATGLVVTNG
ncbi:MAG: hypothetical protein ACOZAM_22370 [Pseudomonadota bacterium]